MKEPKRRLLELASAIPSEMQGLSRVSIGPDFATILIGSDKIVEDWGNDHPVAALIQPVELMTGGLGLLIGKRAIAPFVGEWALISGYLEPGETTVQAAERECAEETGLAASQITTATMRPVAERNTQRGQLITFVENSQRIYYREVYAFRDAIEAQPAAERELSDVDVLKLDDVRRLCFPLHQEIADRWLNRHFKKDDPDNQDMWH